MSAAGEIDVDGCRPSPSPARGGENSNAWPFEEARKIVARLKKRPKDEVDLETGYGPSGLPHIGTFGEVAHHDGASCLPRPHR